ncbi:hypothetical protein [Bifidobacterium mongoliense]|uniref:Uncharacterized protein n=1 Tax=Bifidobacterium mongoliense TaxID=518643 RepID=A0A423UGH8_9BIFI|nr:hypothetical protein [Bifidobacterium mongoliense]MDN6484545.1 hypothetical protein [Bifidobacterium mongoliense]ROT87774.1 hypothetical protein BMONG18_0314 [Bifidobacterium mongoliense]
MAMDDPDGDGRLNERQRDAIHVLASHNAYAAQSKWKTLRELPRKERWPFFVQHFLLATSAILVALIVVISLAVSFLTKPPTPLLAVQGIGMSRYASSLDRLRDGFLRDQGIEDHRLVQVDGTLSIGGDGYADDSAKVMTMVTAGQINMMAAGRTMFATLDHRGYISKPADVLTAAQLRAVAGALVDARGHAVADPAHAAGLDLSKSAVWRSAGLPSDAILGFSNVQSGKVYPQRFVAYLRFS